MEIVGDLSRRPGLVVRAANHGAVLCGQLCQRVADQLPVCHEITIRGRPFGNDMVVVCYQELSRVNIQM